MSTPRPTGFPGWASGASGWVTEPASTTKALGWQPNQAPTSSYQNWLHKLTYDWLKYLDQQTWETVISDDFIRGGGLSPGSEFWDYGQGFTPYWNAHPSRAIIVTSTFAGAASGMAGAVLLDGNNSTTGMTSYCVANIDSAWTVRDFRAEFIAALSFNGSASGGNFGELGMVDQFGFVSTGYSGNVSYWSFRMVPTGAASATMATFTSYSSTGISKLTAIREGGDLSVLINDTEVLHWTGVAFGITQAAFGAKTVHPSGLGTAGRMAMAVDRMTLKMRRGPT